MEKIYNTVIAAFCEQLLEDFFCCKTLMENEMFYIPKGCSYHSYWIPNDYVHFDSIGFLYFPTAKASGYVLQKINQNSAITEGFSPLSKDKEICAASIETLYHLLGILEAELKPAPLRRNISIYEKAVRCMYENPQRSIPDYAKLCGVSESRKCNVSRDGKYRPYALINNP